MRPTGLASSVSPAISPLSSKAVVSDGDRAAMRKRLECFVQAATSKDLSSLESCLRRSFRMATFLEQRQMLEAMVEISDPQVQALAFLLHHEASGSEPLRADASMAQVMTRLGQFPLEVRSGSLINGLLESTPSHFKGDLFCLAVTSCDSLAATLVLEEIRDGGLHAGLCARALLGEALESQGDIGPRRAFNALVLAASLASPAAALHQDLLVATIVQLCSPLQDEKSHATLIRAVEGASSAIKREFDRLIMASSDRRVRARLIPLLSFPALRRPARACLESCAPGTLDSACRHAGHRLALKDRFSILGNSAISMQFRNALLGSAKYGQRAASSLVECLRHSVLDEVELIETLGACIHSHSPMLRWKGEAALLRLSSTPERDRILDESRARHRSTGTSAGPGMSVVDALQQFAGELADSSDWWLGARARLLLRRHPDAFHAFLRRSLADDVTSNLLPLLRVIRRCRLGHALESELLTLASNAGALDGGHRSELVHIFAATRSSAGAAFILRCTVDADVRVQAAVFSVLASSRAEDIGGVLMAPELLERIACTAERSVRRAALRALRVRSRSSFEELMDTLLDGDRSESPELVLDAALCSGRPVVPDVLRLLERGAEEGSSDSGAIVLRVLRAQRGPWMGHSIEQVAV